jgi:hypothetical protein
MAWMIVKAGGTYRRPRSKFSFTFVADAAPQSWPQDVVDFATSKGLAQEVPPPNREAVKARKGKTRA